MTSTTQRDYSKFFTPDHVADFMVKLLNPQAGDLILEPSAGNGSIVRAIKRNCKGCNVFAIEINRDYTEVLGEVADIIAIVDFLNVENTYMCSACVANPPFGNGIDLGAHFSQICKFVEKGGKVVMIVPADFDPQCEHKTYKLDNWSKNSDGTTTEIKIISFYN